ncbi:Acyl-CoA synthetase (AMP-forming)/AMP-acid ligase II [Micromonospora pallida]|uniref:Acyl-CoA synthetase (AMP-forming)/AMP-acid ligase II n=1 Tax=Micromonospora pallida TaxID=145854 RepID=A0A1C6S8Z4_9ACTN|nr:AMP-binding protein [Micromonospora pallida]SCL25751.1 Acyl-CoA synthetase (AMP-forming)/AMP-acid ligase II [Micromonospora pallida]
MHIPTAASTNYVPQALALFEKYGPAEAIVYQGRRLTFADLRSGIQHLAEALRGQGIGAGRAVAVVANNHPDVVMLHFALHLLGCRSIWVAQAPLEHQLDFLGQAGPDVLVYDPRTHAEAGVELARRAGTRTVFSLGPGVGTDLWQAPRRALDPADTLGEPASVFQTSGTTGRPKLVHHRNLLFQTILELATRWVDDGHPTRHLYYGVFWHVSSQLGVMGMLFAGGTQVVCDSFDVTQFFTIIERERITSTNAASPRLYEMLDCPLLDRTDLSSLEMLTLGGSTVAPARLTQALERFGPIVRVAYGMSEAPLITDLNGDEHDPSRPHLLRSCGRAYGDVRIAVRDDAGRDLPPGQHGQVWVSGSLVMAGYWGQPELTAETLVDGWLRTGDTGRLDEEGYLYLVGRERELIVTGAGAVNVYPGPIEDVLTAHPDVHDAAVFAVPDEAFGEAVYACVVPVPGATVTPEELRDLVTERLDTNWTPRDVEFVDALPMIGYGKVDKRALRDGYLARTGTAVGPRE